MKSLSKPNDRLGSVHTNMERAMARKCAENLNRKLLFGVLSGFFAAACFVWFVSLAVNKVKYNDGRDEFLQYIRSFK